MLKSVTVTNHLGESILLELGFPEKSGFLIQEITGLGPSKATVNMTEMATMDGAIFNSSRVNSRNIVMNLKFLFKPTIEDVRQMSYKYFPIKKMIKLTFETDNRVLETYGVVENNDINLFSKEEGCQISILCPDAYFYSRSIATTIFSGVDALFEFPFSNESVTDDKIVMSNVNTDTSQNIIYEGDAEIGFVIYMHALGPVTDITIYNVETKESMFIDTTKLATLTGNAIMAGDDIIISTVKGNKSAYLLRGGSYTNIINCLDRKVDWFELSKGNNVFVYTTATGSNNLEFRVENRVAYEGV